MFCSCLLGANTKFSLYISTISVRQHNIMDMQKSKWLGDGPATRGYMYMMDDMFNEIGGYSEAAKRDIVSEHMRATKDLGLISDLAAFDRAGDVFPLGPEYSYAFLQRSVFRRAERAECLVEREKGQKAREAELQKYLKEGERFKEEHEKRVREGKGAGPYMMAATGEGDGTKKTRAQKNAERKAIIAEETRRRRLTRKPGAPPL